MKVMGQENIVEASKNFFHNLFKEPTSCPIAEILKVISLFPSHIFLVMINFFQEEIIEKYFIYTLSSFQKWKRPGPDNLTVELFFGFYDMLKGDLVKVVMNPKIWEGFRVLLTLPLLSLSKNFMLPLLLNISTLSPTIISSISSLKNSLQII
jgi:hypothetical protein